MVKTKEMRMEERSATPYLELVTERINESPIPSPI
ncbi:unnamed protein product, partial [marine sediment metagenome]